jgi:hypothetical protein
MFAGDHGPFKPSGMPIFLWASTCNFSLLIVASGKRPRSDASESGFLADRSER